MRLVICGDHSSPALKRSLVAHLRGRGHAVRDLGTDSEASVDYPDYAALAALNEARILGVFARLIVRDGKPRYRQFMPRMWGQLQRNLENPVLINLKAWVDRHVPMEARR